MGAYYSAPKLTAVKLFEELINEFQSDSFDMDQPDRRFLLCEIMLKIKIFLTVEGRGSTNVCREFCDAYNRLIEVIPDTITFVDISTPMWEYNKELLSEKLAAYGADAVFMTSEPFRVKEHSRGMYIEIRSLLSEVFKQYSFEIVQLETDRAVHFLYARSATMQKLLNIIKEICDLMGGYNICDASFVLDLLGLPVHTVKAGADDDGS